MGRQNYHITDLCDTFLREEKNKIRAGNEFENDLSWALKKSCKSLENCIGTEIDYNEGTDFRHKDLRIDATLDFEYKEIYMPFSFDTKIPAGAGQNFQIGIRLGNTHNGYTEFPKPVVVVGLRMDAHMYRQYQDEIFDNMIKHADDLMFAINDAHLDYITTDEQERKELFTQPLRKNNKYKRPRKLGEEFDKLNQQQYKLMENNEKGDTEYA